MEKITQENIRNFAIISHIDHGKSTLADRLIEYTSAVEARRMQDRFLDNLDLEREHGVTIKMQAVRMEHTVAEETYTLNLIDTPGHVDFGYEVSRALAACEGALLLIDASQGIQAQTLSNAYKALEEDVVLIPVINKIDLPSADPERIAGQFVDMFGFTRDEILQVSGKTGDGVEELLAALIERIPAPAGDPTAPLKALVFDTMYHQHRGVLAYVRVVDGVLASDEKISFMKGGASGKPVEVGVIQDGFHAVPTLRAGEVGYIATGFKEIQLCEVGDTVTHVTHAATESLPGYEKVKPMVYASLFPVDGDDYESFRDALEKLALNDAALEYRAENSAALGFGFRVGFLGTFHAEIIKERLEHEFDLDLIITYPTVEYYLTMTDGSEHTITSPADLPESSKVSAVREPWVTITMLTPATYLSPLTQVVTSYRGSVRSVQDTHAQLTLTCELPLAEIITNFHDEIKSVSSGYASFDYELIAPREVDLVKVDILVHHEPVPPFARLVVREHADRVGRSVVEKLKDILPRQQFAIPLQAAIGGKIIARETISAYRKDVTAKLYGGDRTRKDKLLKKQAKGKKRMKQMGNVAIPKEAFFKVLQG